MYDNLVARNNFFRRNENFLAVFFQPYLSDVQRHAACQISDGFFMRPFLKQLSYAEQEHDRACGSIVAAEHRNTDCSCIKNRNFDLSLCQCLDSFPDIFYGNNRSIDGTDRCRKKPFSSKVVNHFADQLFLIFVV